MDYAFNEAWTLTVGGRYTKEEKDFLGGNGGVFYIPGQDPSPALLDPTTLAMMSGQNLHLAPHYVGRLATR